MCSYVCLKQDLFRVFLHDHIKNVALAVNPAVLEIGVYQEYILYTCMSDKTTKIQNFLIHLYLDNESVLKCFYYYAYFVLFSAFPLHLPNLSKRGAFAVVRWVFSNELVI